MEIKVLDFEKEIIKSYIEEDKFIEFMEENGKNKLILDYSSLGLKELQEEDLDIMGEETVLDYLEEVASITREEVGEDAEALIVKNLPSVASLAFHYLREGSAYLDMVQEGTMGLMKGIDAYRSEIHGDFDNYKNYWIIREMVIFIENKMRDIKNEFKSYFKNKKEHLGHDHHEEEEKIDDSEVFLTEKDLLPNVEAIEKREKMVEKNIEFSNLRNRLSGRQIDVLNYYFGFGVDRRYSIYEIEQKLNLKNGDGEKIFEQSLLILSTMEGKMFL